MAGPDLEERILRRIPAETLFIAFVMALAAVVLFDAGTALFVLLGGAVAALGFLGMKASLGRVLLREKAGALKSGLLLYLLRLALICLIFSFIILLFPGRVLAFGAGFSALVPVFLVEGWRALLRMKQWKN